MDTNLKQLFTKKNIISFLIVGILVLSVPFSTRLVNQRQSLKSQAAGDNLLRADMKNTTITSTNNQLVQNVQWFDNSPGYEYNISGNVSFTPNSSPVVANIYIDVYRSDNTAPNGLAYINTYTIVDAATKPEGGSLSGNQKFSLAAGDKFAVILRATNSTAQFSTLSLTSQIRPYLCGSAQISGSVLSSDNVLTITSTAKSPITTFMYAFYNIDNLYPAPNNTPQPIMFGGSQFIKTVKALSPTTTYQATISVDEIYHQDENWQNQYPKNVQVNAYFIDSSGAQSQPESACTVSFTVTPPAKTGSLSPTPPPGCYYQQVQCIQAPCNPILVCPTPTCTPRPACLDAVPACKIPDLGIYCPATPTPTPNPSNSICDPDKNGQVDDTDFQIWLEEFTSLRSTKLSDCNQDNKIDLLDFNILRDSRYNMCTGT